MKKFVWFALIGILTACSSPPDTEENSSALIEVDLVKHAEKIEAPALEAVIACLKDLDQGNFQSFADSFISYDDLEKCVNKPDVLLYTGERKYLNSLKPGKLRDEFISDFNLLQQFSKKNSLIWDSSSLELLSYKKSNFLAKTMHEGELKFLLNREIIHLTYRTLSTEEGIKLLSFEKIAF